jgi:hypothetical protein
VSPGDFAALPYLSPDRTQVHGRAFVSLCYVATSVEFTPQHREQVIGVKYGPRLADNCGTPSNLILFCAETVGIYQCAEEKAREEIDCKPPVGRFALIECQRGQPSRQFWRKLRRFPCCVVISYSLEALVRSLKPQGTLGIHITAIVNTGMVPIDADRDRPGGGFGSECGAVVGMRLFSTILFIRTKPFLKFGFGLSNVVKETGNKAVILPAEFACKCLGSLCNVSQMIDQWFIDVR